MKDVLTVISASDQMIKPALDLDSELACQRFENDSRNIADLTPILSVTSIGKLIRRKGEIPICLIDFLDNISCRPL